MRFRDYVTHPFTGTAGVPPAPVAVKVSSNKGSVHRDGRRPACPRRGEGILE